MKIAVTGAGGHVGVCLCNTLLSEGYEVKALVHHVDTGISDLPITIVRGSISDTASLKELMSGCDGVIHTAGIIDLGYHYNQKLADINVEGTGNVLSMAKELGINKLVHFSSIHAFSLKPYSESLDETRHFVNNKAIFYDQTKRDGHQLALQAAEEGLDVSIVCPTSVLGPPDHQPSKLGKAIIDICKGYVPAVVKGGFDFVDVRDVVNGAIAALKKGRKGETYLLGGKYYTLKQFSDLVLEAKGVKKRLPELPLAVATIGLPFVKLYAALTKKEPLYDKEYIDILQDGNKLISTAKAQAELGYTARDLKETLTDTVNWFRQAGKI